MAARLAAYSVCIWLRFAPRFQALPIKQITPRAILIFQLNNSGRMKIKGVDSRSGSLEEGRNAMVRSLKCS